MSIQFSLSEADNGQQFVTVFANGVLSPPADNTHPNFKLIVGACEASLRGESVDADEVIRLFDVAETITFKFQQIGERVSIEGDTVYLDGDAVAGALQDQIIDFVHAGADFGPLVAFYEALVTNPLGDVREGLFSWMQGQRVSGPLTIAENGDVLGYKSVVNLGNGGYRPTRRSQEGGDRVNGVEVAAGGYIEQRPGDVVEMPRSKVLHEPSQACGDGLHIGTWGYASGFSGDTVLLVRFSPRDIVSLPDRFAAGKLRVCRYTVVGVADKPLDVPLYLTEDAKANLTEDAADLILDGPLAAGERVVDDSGDEGVLVRDADSTSGLAVVFDGDRNSSPFPLNDPDTLDPNSGFVRRIHGKGGATSRAAKGRGRNPAQDAAGKFSQGRPGSKRDGGTGRFAA